jgi:hypothetical protein
VAPEFFSETLEKLFDYYTLESISMVQSFSKVPGVSLYPQTWKGCISEGNQSIALTEGLSSKMWCGICAEMIGSYLRKQE